MCGSSASNEYGSGGTENAPGLSSNLRLGSKLFVVVLACKRLATAFVPNSPALTTPPRNRNLRRFIVAPLLRFLQQRRWDYTADTRGDVNKREPIACRLSAFDFSRLSRALRLIGCATKPNGQILKSRDHLTPIAPATRPRPLCAPVHLV